MKALLAATGLVLALGIAPALAADQDCTAMWKAFDVNADGSLGTGETDKLTDVMTKVDTDKDAAISQAEFTAACQAGDLKDVKM